MSDFTLYNEDCLQAMKRIESFSVDAIIADLPYGTTRAAWDNVIPLADLWEQYKRIVKPNGAIVLTACQPFTTALIVSQPELFRYDLVWNKSRPTGFLNCLRRPLNAHESILIFCNGQSTYNPQMSKGYFHLRGGKRSRPTQIYGEFSSRKTTEHNEYYPRSVVDFAVERKPLHPTQKPAPLMAYLIRTYTNEGETVLDNTMGSGTTGVAAIQTGRNFIGMELDKTYFDIAIKRITDASLQTSLGI